jgi:DNA-binding MarR family transcriptional regulator
MSTETVLKLGCACATLRRASRALTQTYELEMRKHGLRASQFTILQVLSRAGEITQGTLGEVLAMDSTTLTRTLKVMAGSGWIAQRPGKDRRERLVRLSSSGMKKMEEALPAWNKSQQDLRSKLGTNNWEQVETLLNQIVDVTAR